MEQTGMTGMFTHGSAHSTNAGLRNQNLQDVIHPRGTGPTVPHLYEFAVG